MLRQKQIRNHTFDTLANFQAALPLKERELSYVVETNEWYLQRNATENVKVTNQGTFPVIEILDFTSAEPTGQAVGDIYINTVNGNGSATGQAVNAASVYQWDGALWLEIVPFHGMFVYNENTDSLWGFNNILWVELGGGTPLTYVSDITARNALTGLNAGDRVFVLQTDVLYEWDGTTFNSLDATDLTPVTYAVTDSGLTTAEINTVENGRQYEMILSTAPPATFTVDAPSPGLLDKETLTFFFTVFPNGTAGDYTINFATNYKNFAGDGNFGPLTITPFPASDIYIAKYEFIRAKDASNEWHLINRSDTGYGSKVFYSDSTIAQLQAGTATDAFANTIEDIAGDVVYLSKYGSYWKATGSGWFALSVNGESATNAVTIGTLVAPDIDLSYSFNISASAPGDTETIQAPVNAGNHEGNIVKFRMVALGGNDVTVSFDPIYQDASGNPIPDVFVDSDEVEVYTFRIVGNRTTPDRMVLVSPSSLGGGLIQRGTITTNTPALGNSIYTLNSSGGSFNLTLPSATGSQDRVMIIAADVETNNPFVTVQTGENLNNTLNGSYTIDTNGRIYLATDRGVGLWDIATFGINEESTLVRSKITSSSTQNIPNTTVTQLDFDAVEYDNAGFADLANNQFLVTKAGRYIVHSSVATNTNGNPGGQIATTWVSGTRVAIAKYSVDGSGNGTGFNTTTAVLDLVPGDTVYTQFFQSTGAALSKDGNADSNYLSIYELPSREVVLAGSIDSGELYTQNGTGSSRRMIVGSVDIGDVGVGTTATVVAGDITSVSKSNPSASVSAIIVQHPTITNPAHFITVRTAGGSNANNNDIAVPIVYNVTNTQFVIYLEQTVNTTQDLILNIMVVSQT